jgi:hypothetical protein
MGKPEGRKPLGLDDIKMYPEDVGWKRGVD